MNKPIFLSVLISFISLSIIAQKSIPLAPKTSITSISKSLKIEYYIDKSNDCTLSSLKRDRYLDSALAITPKSACLWQQKAIHLLKQKKYEPAISFLDSAVKYNPDPYLEYRAFIKCIFQKNYKGAIEDFRLASRFKTRSSAIGHPADFYLTLCYIQLNKMDSAEFFLSRCMAAEDKKLNQSGITPLDWFYSGIICLEKQEYKKGIEHFNKCLFLSEDFADAEYYKAICLENCGKEISAYNSLLHAKAHLKRGYTFDESYSDYEMYPYQLNKDVIQSFLLKLEVDHDH